MAQGPTLPAVKEVHHYKGDVWEAIWQATQGKPLAAWLLGGHDKQINVDQFVLQDGRTYRTQDGPPKTWESVLGFLLVLFYFIPS